MNIAQVLLLDFDDEIDRTRRTLQLIPEDAPSWAPHAKSMPIGRLAVHVSRLPHFGAAILTTSELDLATSKWPPMVFESREKLLTDLAQAGGEARHHLASATDDHLMGEWRLHHDGHTIAAGPRATLYRTMFLNHLVHHRAQLGVYLRLRDLPVPALYGPSADEQFKP